MFQFVEVIADEPSGFVFALGFQMVAFAAKTLLQQVVQFLGVHRKGV